MRILILSILFITVFGDDIVKDRHRACPEGFRYFGEVDVPVHDRDYWVQGERTPTYSCYQVKYGNFSWLEATHECFKTDSQLIRSTTIMKRTFFFKTSLKTSSLKINFLRLYFLQELV